MSGLTGVLLMAASSKIEERREHTRGRQDACMSARLISSLDIVKVLESINLAMALSIQESGFQANITALENASGPITGGIVASGRKARRMATALRFVQMVQLGTTVCGTKIALFATAKKERRKV